MIFGSNMEGGILEKISNKDREISLAYCWVFQLGYL